MNASCQLNFEWWWRQHDLSPTIHTLSFFDQNTHRPMYTADFDGDGERSIVLPVRSLVHKWILSKRPHQGVYFKLYSDNRVATNSSVQVIEGSGFQKRRNRPLLIVKTLPTKTKLFEDMESLIKWVYHYIQEFSGFEQHHEGNGRPPIRTIP